jgi:hypothetical protein
MEKYYEINAPAVISEPMDEELVVINLDSGCYYSLNKTAARLWNHLERGCSINQIARQMALLYGSEEASVLADFTSFVERLLRENLIRRGSGGKTNELFLPETLCESYLKPSLEKYSDMQEMLLLDPIHEVSEAGWPHKEKK